MNRCKCTRSQRKIYKIIFPKNRSRKDHNHFFPYSVLPSIPSVFLRRFTIPTFHNNYTISLFLSLFLIEFCCQDHPSKETKLFEQFFFFSSSFSSPFLYHSSFDYMETYSHVLSLSIQSVKDSRLEWGKGGGKKRRRRVWQMELVENGGGGSSSCCIGLVKGENKHRNIGGCIV